MTFPVFDLLFFVISLFIGIDKRCICCFFLSYCMFSSFFFCFLSFIPLTLALLYRTLFPYPPLISLSSYLTSLHSFLISFFVHLHVKQSPQTCKFLMFFLSQNMTQFYTTCNTASPSPLRRHFSPTFSLFTIKRSNCTYFRLISIFPWIIKFNPLLMSSYSV